MNVLKELVEKSKERKYLFDHIFPFCNPQVRFIGGAKWFIDKSDVRFGLLFTPINLRSVNEYFEKIKMYRLPSSRDKDQVGFNL